MALATQINPEEEEIVKAENNDMNGNTGPFEYIITYYDL